MPDIEFPTSAGSAPGYLAVPAGEHGPGVIVLQEWWGLDEHIRSICDRLAAEGFYALAPDLYRGETTDQPSEAQQKMMALSMEQAEKDMCGAADYLLSQPGCEGPGVGAVGFCLGGGLAVWAAATCPNITAAVSYYYVMPHGKPDFSGIDGPVLGHFGTADEFVPLEAAKALEAELQRRRRGRHLPLLRGRRPRVLQRHQPSRHLRRRAAPSLVGAHRRASCARRSLLEPRIPARPRRGGRLAVVGAGRPRAPARPARQRPRARRRGSCSRATAPTTPPARGRSCGAPSASCPGGEGARVARIGADDVPGRKHHPAAPPPGGRSRRAARSSPAAPRTGRS